MSVAHLLFLLPSSPVVIVVGEAESRLSPPQYFTVWSPIFVNLLSGTVVSGPDILLTIALGAECRLLA